MALSLRKTSAFLGTKLAFDRLIANADEAICGQKVEQPVISDSGNLVFSINTQILLNDGKTMYAPIGHLA